MISEEAESEKPDTRIFQKALNKLQIKPTEAMYVGDHLEIDIVGANRTGMISVRIIKGKYNYDKANINGIEPRYTIRKLSDLLKILERGRD
jgi:putative hydrolase of the HAD superfamily